MTLLLLADLQLQLLLLSVQVKPEELLHEQLLQWLGSVVTLHKSSKLQSIKKLNRTSEPCSSGKNKTNAIFLPSASLHE